MAKKTMIDEDAEEFLKENYLTMKQSELCEILGCCQATLNSALKRLGLNNKWKVIREQLENSETITCKICGGDFKSEELFHRRDKNGDYRPTNICRVCYNNKQRNIKNERYVKQKEKIEKIKERKKETAKEMRTCATCGETKLGKYFRFQSKSMDRDATCTHCKTIKDTEYKVKRIKGNELW